MPRHQQKSAKDIAFDRERTRLQSRIQQLSNEISSLNGKLAVKDSEIAELKNTIEILEKYIGLPKETILEQEQRSNKIEKFVDLFTAMGSVY